MTDSPPALSGALDFSDRVVLVTGGGAGVGRGISERFLAAGAVVVICGRHEPESLPASGGRNATFVSADVRDAEQVGALVDQVVARHGRIDVAVNNAGGSPPADSATVSPKFTTAIVALNLLGPLFVSQRANAVMQTQAEGGLIINIGSVSGLRPSPSTVAYGAAKAGLLSATQTLAMEWAPRVRVNMITVGIIKTEKSHLFYGDETGLAAVDATVPFGRMAAPADVGDACLLLTSPLARYITGANLAVHGGGERPPYLGASTGEVAAT